MDKTGLVTATTVIGLIQWLQVWSIMVINELNKIETTRVPKDNVVAQKVSHGSHLRSLIGYKPIKKV